MNMGMAAAGPQGYGATDGAQYNIIMPGKPGGRRRMNMLAISLNLFVPWIIFCLICALLSFEMHYTQPSLCQTIVVILGTFLVIVCALDFAWLLRRRARGEGGLADPSWLLFLCVSSIVALSLAVAFGNRNFWTNMEPFYDIRALNSYVGVDPTRMRGQELMDAGRVVFVRGTHLDITKSMGFKNMQTFCVAPITGGGDRNTPLASYDFWAVGKDCCSGALEADFHCGDYSNPQARGGVRAMRDEERAYYRLAVQQAQSAYAIKAIHPLFFHWVQDPTDSMYGTQQDAFKALLVAMFAYFGFQLLLVSIATVAFSKFALTSQ